MSEKSKKKSIRNQNKARERKTRILRISLLVIILALVNIYVVLGLIYKGDGFTITLDSENGRKSNLVIYDSPSNKNIEKTYLKADSIDSFSDISVDWLPQNINNEADGPHNGNHYIAYTFYAENMGNDTINYWTRIDIDDVVKNVDEAIRVMVYKNGEKTIYAKPNSITKEAEKGTTKFYSTEDNIIMLQQNSNFKVGDIDKYTVVIWVEGDDQDCIDSLIGGEIKMHMTLTEEHLKEE